MKALTTQQKPVEIFILAGQSNAEGYGALGQLENLSIGGVEIWAQKPASGWVGHPTWSSDSPYFMYPRPDSSEGTLFNTNNSTYQAPNSWYPYLDYNRSTYGPEVSFMYRMHHTYPGVPFAMIKCVMGGTSVETDWSPSVRGKMFDVLATQIRQAEARLTAAGILFQFAGLLWMQGENGAATVYPYLHKTSTFKPATETLFAAIRNITNPSLPIVEGRIGDQMLAPNIITPLVAPNGINTYANLVAATQFRRQEQVEIASEVPGCVWVDTDNLPVWQNGNPAFWYHFTGAGYLAMGERFARAYILQQGGVPTF